MTDTTEDSSNSFTGNNALAFPTPVTLMAVHFKVLEKYFYWVNHDTVLNHRKQPYTPQPFTVEMNEPSKASPQVQVHCFMESPEGSELWQHGGKLMQDNRAHPVEVRLKEVFLTAPDVILTESVLQVNAMQWQKGQLTLSLTLPKALHQPSVPPTYRPHTHPTLFD